MRSLVCPRPILLVLLMIVAGLLVALWITPPLSVGAYGPRGDGSDPLVPAVPHIGADGNIYWNRQP